MNEQDQAVVDEQSQELVVHLTLNDQRHAQPACMHIYITN
jgi:hypothetical protein